MSPVESIDVEAVDEDGTVPAVHLSHGIRHIILQQQQKTPPVVTTRRQHHSNVVRVTITCSSYFFEADYCDPRASVTFSVTRLRCANTDKRIKVLFEESQKRCIRRESDQFF